MGSDERKKMLIESFQDTLRRSELYPVGNVEVIKEDVDLEAFGGSCRVSVRVMTTFECAYELYKSGYENITCLCFSSAKHVGGGVETGAMAQEECLCRESNLFNYLRDDTVAKDFYEYHQKKRDCRYSDRMIWSEGVTVLKDSNLKPLRKAFKVNVINVAAPNQTNCIYKDIDEILFTRYSRMVALASVKGSDALVLGAIGCGVFRNNPEVVANAFKVVLSRGVGHNLKEVIFAIPDKTNSGKRDKKYRIFNTILCGGKPYMIYGG